MVSAGRRFCLATAFAFAPIDELLTDGQAPVHR